MLFWFNKLLYITSINIHEVKRYLFLIKKIYSNSLILNIKVHKFNPCYDAFQNYPAIKFISIRPTLLHNFTVLIFKFKAYF